MDFEDSAGDVLAADVGDGELSPEILDLLERCAALPHGLAFVHRAPCECVAAALGVLPETVERTCDCLDRDARAAVVRAYGRAVERRRTSPPPAPPTFVARAPRGVDEAIAAAEASAFGLEFLLRAPIESAAIMFGVHPEIVAQARERLGAQTP